MGGKKGLWTKKRPEKHIDMGRVKRIMEVNVYEEFLY